MALLKGCLGEGSFSALKQSKWILSVLLDKDFLLAKATISFWDSDSMEDSELAFTHNLYDRGVSNLVLMAS